MFRNNFFKLHKLVNSLENPIAFAENNFAEIYIDKFTYI